MRTTNPWASYRQVATQTASSGQLVLMLFDGALRFLSRAAAGFAEEDPAVANETINNNVQRAQAIIMELNTSLNLAEGGQLAQTLRQLYNYFDRRLQHSNMTKTPDGIAEVSERVMVLRDAWAQMLQNQTERPPAAATPAELLAA
jgi:flagellar secretion chaperone FliS